jgi:hypothetical protein
MAGAIGFVEFIGTNCFRNRPALYNKLTRITLPYGGYLAYDYGTTTP